MKILAVSLLRLGDLLLAAPALAGLKRQYPDAEIDLLVNDQARPAAQLISDINRIHIFPRQDVQAGLTQPETPLFEPFFVVEDLVAQLNHENYDLVVNFTHNRISGMLCSLIKATQYCGLVLDAEGRPQFGSNWFRYLNDNADQLGTDIFHYADIFRFALGQSGTAAKVRWRITESNIKKAQTWIKPNVKTVALQPFTSEEKKEWGDASWIHMARSCDQEQIRFLILCAPNEISRAEAMASQMRTSGIQAEVACTTLGEAAAVIAHSQLLVTGDTSIKHLAIAYDTPVIELSLGSSDWRRTGLYRERGFILQSGVSCAPCPHSQPCSQSQHICAQVLAPDRVATFLTAVLNDDARAIRDMAYMGRDRIQVWQTGMAETEYWDATSIGHTFGPEEIKSAVDKLTTKIVLRGQHRAPIAPYGTEALRLKQYLKREHPQLNPLAWQSLFQSVMREADRQKSDAASVQHRLDGMIAASQSQPVVELKEMRKLQNKIEDIGDRLEVRRRLLRSLMEAAEVVV